MRVRFLTRASGDRGRWMEARAGFGWGHSVIAGGIIVQRSAGVREMELPARPSKYMLANLCTQ
jgi:hypothetical protein